jgi:site-specific recombinase XerD
MDADFMFPGRDGVSAIDRTTIFRAFQLIAKAAGIPATHSHVHVLKHSLGRNLVQANVTLPLIKKRLGHVSLAATAVYTTATDADAATATQTALSQLFSKRGRCDGR